ncbi:nitroreductase family protein [Tahibacter caeni]|uniref:nitroreductase family protein n=1 Tax=Tahibacter caeni TaxID=1453545 RepID=UPI00214993DB|nr:nitroreductase family protein [Tahibacter caeni]
MTDSDRHMSVHEAIAGRCAVRDYAALVPGDTQLERLLQAAVRAPTALHEELWRFAVIRERALLDRISACAKAAMSARADGLPHDAMAAFTAEDFHIFYNAPALIVIGTEAPGRFTDADCWLAAENLMLAAHAEGLGSCVIGLAVDALNDVAVKRAVGLPAGFTAVSPVIVGTPANPAALSPTPRKPPHVVLWS